MSTVIEGRKFQLWEYHVSHGSLLIRSPAEPGLDTSVDIIFIGVQYLAAPRHLGQITISEANEIELASIKKTIPNKSIKSRAWLLRNANQRFVVTAVAMKIEEHRGDIFDSPFNS